ncbi:MAG: hypothetical protein ABSD38_10655 [Syntrophorhabdales bacterium]
MTKKHKEIHHREGGPLSDHRELVGNLYGESSDIGPLTEDETVEWLEKHDRTSILVRLFPEKLLQAYTAASEGTCRPRPDDRSLRLDPQET